MIRRSILQFFGIPILHTSFAQLYNLSTDPSEKENIAEAHPDKVKELSALLNEVKGAKEQQDSK